MSKRKPYVLVPKRGPVQYGIPVFKEGKGVKYYTPPYKTQEATMIEEFKEKLRGKKSDKPVKPAEPRLHVKMYRGTKKGGKYRKRSVKPKRKRSKSKK
jgi:hypothetical protein